MSFRIRGQTRCGLWGSEIAWLPFGEWKNMNRDWNELIWFQSASWVLENWVKNNVKSCLRFSLYAGLFLINISRNPDVATRHFHLKSFLLCSHHRKWISLCGILAADTSFRSDWADFSDHDTNNWKVLVFTCHLLFILEKDNPWTWL